MTVVKFGDTEIQFPSICKNEKTVFVSCEDGNFSIIDKQLIDEQSVGIDTDETVVPKNTVKKKRNKKTTNETQE